MRKRIWIDVSCGFYLHTAALLLLCPLRWVIAFFVAVIIHEAGHLLALIICRINIESIRVQTNGVRICCEYMKPEEQLLCALCGPSAGLIVTLFADKFTAVSVVCYVHSLVNLLPIYPFDGGRALKSLLELIFGLPKGTIIGEKINFALKAMIVGMVGIFLVLTFSAKMIN